MKNTYHNATAEKLLELKRLEADTLRDLLRSVNNPALDTKSVCMIVRNVLRAQIGVKKMMFFYKSENEWKEGIRLHFDCANQGAIAEMQLLHYTTKITEEVLPLLHELGTEYVIPLNSAGGLTNAYFLIADFADSEEEAQSDLIFIETVGQILATAIQNRQLIREQMQQEFLKRELHVASDLQKQLLLSDFGRFLEIDVHAINIPFQGVGGDYYDVIKKGKGLTFVCIADVSGKGISAALLMSNLQANLRAACANHDDLSLIVESLNRIIFRLTGGERFVTLFLAKIDTRQKTCSYINAGHDYPALVQNGKIRWLESQGTFVGIMPVLKIKEDSFMFSENDHLFLYTDGLVDQKNPIGQTFNTDKIAETLLTFIHLSAKDLIEYFVQSIKNFAQNVEATDDLTLLDVRFLA